MHELHESKFPFVSRIDRSKLSNFSAHVYGVSITGATAPADSREAGLKTTEPGVVHTDSGACDY